MRSVKHFLAAGMVFLSIFANAQVNSPGSIYAGGGLGINFGGGAFETNISGRSETNSEAGVGFNLGLKAQYSFTSKFSAGLYLKTNAAGYASLEDDKDWNTLGARQLMFGVEAKYYMLNKKRILLSVGPIVGLTTSKDKIEFDDGYYGNTVTVDGTSSGINYGINFGFNFFWSSHVGMFVDVGLNGSSLKGDYDSYSAYTYKLSNLGVAAGVGIIGRFGGKPQPEAVKK